ncbi:M15 family metallopeptidase [Hyphomonadaceae bacterium ML37]|nr:M15 family metallopeptidase [Hyphomonadaceae bacterium ML37]
MGFRFSARSEQRLRGVHPHLERVIRRALEISPLDFTIVEGLRTIEQQQEYVARGASTTMNSRHLTGHAVDIAPFVDGSLRWDWPLFHILAPVVKQAAEECGVPVEWGGDWQSFPDGPHWQLPWAQYPKSEYDASAAQRAGGAAVIDPDTGRVDADEAQESDQERTALAAVGVTAGGAAVTAVAGAELSASGEGPADPPATVPEPAVPEAALTDRPDAPQAPEAIAPVASDPPSAPQEDLGAAGSMIDSVFAFLSRIWTEGSVWAQIALVLGLIIFALGLYLLLRRIVRWRRARRQARKLARKSA